MFSYKVFSSKWAIFCLLAVVALIIFGRSIWFNYVQLNEGTLLGRNRFFLNDLFYKDKISFWQKTVADSPQLFQAHNGLAIAYLTEGKTEEAMVEFEKTLEINPQVKRVHLLLGLNYLDQGQYSDAQKEFEKEIEVDPNQFVAHHNLGRIFAQKKNLKEAEKHFIETLEINPGYLLVHQDLAVLYFSQNKHPQAIVHLKELLKRQTEEDLHPQIRKILEIYAKEAALQLGL